MKHKDFSHIPTGVAAALQELGDRWNLLIIASIFSGAHRFESIQQSLGIARNILSNRLSDFVARGVLERRMYTDKPPRFEYHLTQKGIETKPILDALEVWGDKWCRGGSGDAASLPSE